MKKASSSMDGKKLRSKAGCFAHQSYAGGI
jgi:hypothetical protein